MACLHVLQVMITPPTCVFCRHLCTCEHSSVMRGSCHLAIIAKYFFIHPRQVAVGHVVAPEPSRAGRQDPEPWDAWWHGSPPEQGGGIRSRGTCGDTGALLSGEVGFGNMGRVAAPELSQKGGRDWYRGTCDSAWTHTLLLALAQSLYMGVPGL
jgi:hypothetical protein